MNVHDLVNQIADWHNTLIGAGYKNQKYPNSYLEDETRQFFAAYPPLERDKDYVEFIEYYSGLLVFYPNQELIVTVYGLWSDYVTNVLYPNEPLVEDSRHFNFASIIIDSTNKGGDIIVIAFAFDLQADEKPFIFRRIITENQQRTRPPYTVYCDGFLDWLERLVASSGRLID